MTKYDLVIRGGTVATASDTFRADVGIRDGRIVALAESLDHAGDGGQPGLAVGEGADAAVGDPLVAGAKVVAKVLEQTRADKILVFKKNFQDLINSFNSI